MSVLGIELGSTRIKAVLIDEARRVRQTGVHEWENKYENGHWTYALEDVWAGIKDAAQQIEAEQASAIGISAMMHGYLVFDKKGELLTPFRTWRDTTAQEASGRLTQLFGFNIPRRWSVAHLYQAILDGEAHVRDIGYITTLAGYVHWKLTGERVLGLGDASGMFPIADGGYNRRFVGQFRELTGIDWRQIAPRPLPAGVCAGTYKGVPLCPPEGDAGTGLMATGTLAPRTGNVSAGTSVFATVVLEKPLARVYPEIDVVVTPLGDCAAMVHANECTAKIDPWLNLFGEAFDLMGAAYSRGELFTRLYEAALGDTKLSAFMRQLLESAVSELSAGLRILTEREGVKIDSLAGHGGFFKSGRAGQAIMSEMLGLPIHLVAQSAEGGAYGAGLLAAKIGGIAP
ncbi:MAG: ATPase [Gracilibacteraceae bacterium]|jgi:sugar (pentulose or hexulose) kinase|nr:ATPase [Gracilibacteraceae bacterium]